MKPMTAAQVEAHLRMHGFVRVHGSGSHRGYFNPATGRQTVVPFHGNRTFPQGTLLAIFRQAGIPPPKR